MIANLKALKGRASLARLGAKIVFGNFGLGLGPKMINLGSPMQEQHPMLDR